MLLIIYRVSLLTAHLFLDPYLGDRGFWFYSELAPFTDVFFSLLHPAGTSTIVTNATVSKDSDFNVIMVVYENVFFSFFICYLVIDLLKRYYLILFH